jgi:DNA-binding MarR family transcriptional regulator
VSPERYDWSSFRFPGHRAVVTTVQVAERLSKAADRFLAHYKLTLAQFNFLAILRQEPAGIHQSEIGARLVVSRANITGLVGRMKQAGLCRVVSDPQDARLKRIRITAAGDRLIDRIEGPYLAEIRRITRSFSAGEMEQLSETLDRLLRSI